jgi:hypothetical protein
MVPSCQVQYIIGWLGWGCRNTLIKLYLFCQISETWKPTCNLLTRVIYNTTHQDLNWTLNAAKLRDTLLLGLNYSESPAVILSMLPTCASCTSHLSISSNINWSCCARRTFPLLWIDESSRFGGICARCERCAGGTAGHCLTLATDIVETSIRQFIEDTTWAVWEHQVSCFGL